MSIVEEVVGEVAEKVKVREKLLVIKSTSLPGTTKKMAREVPQRRFCYES